MGSLKKRKKYHYFRTVPRIWNNYGDRYFRICFDEWEAVQICVTLGETKKGKGNAFGIYVISKMTLFSNYMAMQRVKPIRKAQYDKAFKLVVKALK